MARFLKKNKKTIGQVPGELLFIGKQVQEKVSAQEFTYNTTVLEEHKLEPSELYFIDDDEQRDTIRWIDINGLHDTKLIRTMGERFSIHPLSLEDILNTGGRAKMEDCGTYILFVLKMIRFDEENTRIDSEQVSFILGKQLLISFQEKEGDTFAPVRDRLRNSLGRVRESSSDYLCYALLDSIVDNYLYTIERLGDGIEALEESLLTKPSQSLLDTLHVYRRELRFLYRAIRPFQDAVLQLLRCNSKLLSPQTSPFLRDLADLSVQSAETGALYKEVIADYIETYNSKVNNNMNQVMKILTMFSTIFIPLSFLAGVYGMNFSFMPELSFRYAYMIFWGLILILAGTMITFFKRKHWF